MCTLSFTVVLLVMSVEGLLTVTNVEITNFS